MRDGGDFDKCFYVTRSDLLSLKSETVLRHVPPHLSLLVPHPNSNLIAAHVYLIFTHYGYTMNRLH